jgi:hypothetical protein
LSAI